MNESLKLIMSILNSAPEHRLNLNKILYRVASCTRRDISEVMSLVPDIKADQMFSKMIRYHIARKLYYGKYEYWFLSPQAVRYLERRD
jgi:hypothetical protein